jgi:cell division protein FtsB
VRDDDSSRPRRTAFTLFAVLGIVLLGFGVFMASEKRVEVDEKKGHLAAEEARLEELEQTRAGLEEWERALGSDPAAVEDSIRRKLHWVRPGERVLSWQDAISDGETPVSSTSP